MSYLFILLIGVGNTTPSALLNAVAAFHGRRYTPTPIAIPHAASDERLASHMP